MDWFSWTRGSLNFLPSRIAATLAALIWLGDTPNPQYPLHIPSLSRCAALKDTLHLENTTILEAAYIHAHSNISVPGTCIEPDIGATGRVVVESSVCRVYFVVNTTEDSAVHAEAWLPDEWYGRFLATGNGGLGGCECGDFSLRIHCLILWFTGIAYPSLNYGASMHFATVGSDNGHDGQGGLPFFNHPEVINDFAYRAIHVQTVVGKQIAEAYYGRPAAKSYYIGCSTGGRQGHQAALKYPEDFDGIIAGAPASDFNHLLGWSAMLGKYVGSRDSETYIQPALWKEIEKEILNQCDALDGLVDGILSEPDDCHFNPETLLCDSSLDKNGHACASETQVEVLKKIYSPLLDEDGVLLYPRYDPGAEAGNNWRPALGGDGFILANVRFFLFVLSGAGS